MFELFLMFCFIELFTIAAGLYFYKKESDKKDVEIESLKKEIEELKENEERCKIKVIRVKKK